MVSPPRRLAVLRHGFVIAHHIHPPDFADVRGELEGHLAAMVTVQRAHAAVDDAVIEPRPPVAGDAAHVDLVAVALLGGRVVVRVRRELDDVAVRDALAAAVRLAIGARIRVAVARVRLAAAAAILQWQAWLSPRKNIRVELTTAAHARK